MAKKIPSSSSSPDPDRYLKKRASRWHYVRRVPAHVAGFDPRGTIQVSLKTSSHEVARIKRDAFEKADDLYWSGLADGHQAESVVSAYNAARTRALALGFEYLSSANLAASRSLDEILRRVEKAKGSGGREAPALLGAHERPALTVREATEYYFNTMAADEARGMSEYQFASWKKVKRYAAESFISVVDNKPLLEITRADAQRYYEFWLDRVKGSKGGKRMSSNTANRSFGNMRKLFKTYANWLALDIRNPFDGLSFRNRKSDRRVVPPFEAEWIKTKFLVPGAFGRLNDDARLIFLALIETGCRPSEICNLRPENIRLNHPVPHLAIRFQPDRLIKTESSIREIPLLGVSLEAMKRAPKGFPRYSDKETNLSATLMKGLRSAKLLPSEEHSVYSIRHSFEKRMQEAGLDYDLRCRLMGHANDRPQYGDGGSLEWRRDQLKKIVLPFDPAILA
ncbi:integrase [Mesorhizobium sp. B3-2-1]|uniref:DUF6538 domain-containing protein n=1 Tax=Mesorhizobium sp. B3-2-1 TaxID=2589891 RepID=UPI00112CB2D7|nr:tyrosine-type recombinase/integrase [Mesorhizobium sp. B3-2-1]TPI27291.1 integrase [Mesorhizobium sp. B3-2-1]